MRRIFTKTDQMDLNEFLRQFQQWSWIFCTTFGLLTNLFRVQVSSIGNPAVAILLRLALIS